MAIDIFSPLQNIAQIIAQDPSSAVDHIREGNLLYINAVNKVCSSGSMDTLSPEYAEKLSRLNTDSGMNAQGFYPYFCTEAVMESLLDHARRISAKSFLELFRMRSYLACMLSILAGPDFNKTEMTTTEETNASTTSSSSSTFVSPKQLFVDLGGIELLRMPSSENINGVGGGLRSPDPAIRAIASRIMQLLMEEGKYLRCCDKCSRRETRASEFKLCAKCRFNVYCSKECQVDDWKIGGHKSLCVQL